VCDLIIAHLSGVHSLTNPRLHATLTTAGSEEGELYEVMHVENGAPAASEALNGFDSPPPRPPPKAKPATAPTLLPQETFGPGGTPNVGALRLGDDGSDSEGCGARSMHRGFCHQPEEDLLFCYSRSDITAVL
jgi:hypothetical protein